MGYASPQTGFLGFVANDTTMFKDTTEYTSTSTSWALVLSGHFITDTRANSTLRLKCQFKQQQNGEQAYFELRNVTTGDVYVSDSDLVGGAYNPYSNDFTILESARGDTLGIYLKTSSAVATHKAMIKDIEIAGSLSPMVFS